eukprot:4796806-Pyramimonas_sp.AAC.1
MGASCCRELAGVPAEAYRCSYGCTELAGGRTGACGCTHARSCRELVGARVGANGCTRDGAELCAPAAIHVQTCARAH